MRDEGLIDLGFAGPKFTWNHGSDVERRRSVRLDRALSNLNWQQSFPDATVIHCPHSHSDHCPLLLNTKPARSTPLGERPFRFEAAWFSHRGFMKFVEDNWSRGTLLPMAIEEFTSKIRKWNKEEFGDIKKRKDRLRRRLEGVQTRLATELSPGLLKLESKLKILWEEVLF